MADVPDTAMVFAAGLGTRMRPITDTVPKPLVQVGGRSLLDHMLDRFAEAGIARAIVNVHYLANAIEERLAAREQPAIVISDERTKLLDQGGGIRKVLPFLENHPFFIGNTDALWIEEAGSEIAALRDLWDARSMDVLLLLAKRDGAVGVDWPGDFHIRADGRLQRRVEGEEADFVYAGVGIMKAALFAAHTAEVFRLAPFFFDAASRGKLYGHIIRGRWLHVGTPAAIGEAEKALLATAS